MNGKWECSLRDAVLLEVLWFKTCKLACKVTCKFWGQLTVFVTHLECKTGRTNGECIECNGTLGTPGQRESHVPIGSRRPDAGWNRCDLEKENWRVSELDKMLQIFPAICECSLVGECSLRDRSCVKRRVLNFKGSLPEKVSVKFVEFIGLVLSKEASSFVKLNQVWNWKFLKG